jgi:hypothetical protein
VKNHKVTVPPFSPIRGRRRRLRRSGGAQEASRVVVATKQRDREGCPSAVLAGLDVSAQLDEQRQHVVIRSSGEVPETVRRSEGRVQRRLAVLEARSTAGQAVGVVFDQALDQFAIPHRHGREDVMPRSTIEKQGNHGSLPSRAAHPITWISWRSPEPTDTSNTVEVRFEEDLYSPLYGGRQFSILDINGLTLIFWQPEWLGPNAAA